MKNTQGGVVGWVEDHVWPSAERPLTSAMPGIAKAPVLPGWAHQLGLPLVSRVLARPHRDAHRALELAPGPLCPPFHSAAVESSPAKPPPQAHWNNERLWNLQAISSLLSFWRCRGEPYGSIYSSTAWDRLGVVARTQPFVNCGEVGTGPLTHLMSSGKGNFTLSLERQKPYMQSRVGAWGGAQFLILSIMPL